MSKNLLNHLLSGGAGLVSTGLLPVFCSNYFQKSQAIGVFLAVPLQDTSGVLLPENSNLIFGLNVSPLTFYIPVPPEHAWVHQTTFLSFLDVCIFQTFMACYNIISP